MLIPITNQRNTNVTNVSKLSISSRIFIDTSGLFTKIKNTFMNAKLVPKYSKAKPDYIDTSKASMKKENFHASDVDCPLRRSNR